MSFFRSVKEAVARKLAGRIHSKYSYTIDKFDLSVGTVSFANWKNPLVPPKQITQSELDFYKRFITPGSFCLDIGANVGDTTVPMALVTGKEGLVIGFDPNPLVYEILTVNAGLNKDLTNIVTVPYAITEEPGEFYYNSSEASFGNGGVSSTKKNHFGRYSLENKIVGVNLLDYLQTHYPTQINKLSYLKVDVEGHDIDVLRSARSLIETTKPVLVAECFLLSTPDERKALYDLVAGMGYDLFYFEDFDINTTISKLTRDDMNRWPNFNFYATPV